MSPYPILFSPLKVNQLELKNRIVIPPMHLGYTPVGKVTDQLIAFYAERARGGAALMIVGGCTISPLAGGPFLISIMSDADMEGLGNITRAVHREGGLIGAQLYHAGAYAHRAFLGGEQAVSSSGHTSRFTRGEARGLNLEEIIKVQEEFVAAGKRAQEAGFDMVEILGSAGYLISQFLSPKINKRGDRYGGSLENRMRFGLEVVQKVRAAVGPEYALGIRIAGNDFVPGSHQNPEAAIFARACQEAGVDLIDVTGGWHETKVPQITGELPPAGLTYLARGVKRAVKIPVCASNRINTPELAEDVLARGDADLICIARAILADPRFPGKAQAGRPDLIRPCLACNQGCFDAIFKLGPVGCMTNPRAGKEAQPLPQPADPPRKVVVAGGGPAGCQAALTAAQRGHEVILLEAQERLGGQPAWYCQATDKPDYGRLGPYHTAALAEAGVQVRTGVRASVDYIVDLAPEAVIVATGGVSLEPPIPGMELSHVLDAWEVLKGNARPRGRVIIIGGGAVGLETAILVARKGALTPEQLHFLTLFRGESPETLAHLVVEGSHAVTVLEMLPKVGKEIGKSTKWIVLAKLKQCGVTVRTKTKVLGIESGLVRAEGEDGEHIFEANTVIVAAGFSPQDELSAALKEKGLDVHIVGDAAGAGNVLDSIAQGFRAGSQI